MTPQCANADSGGVEIRLTGKHFANVGEQIQVAFESVDRASGNGRSPMWGEEIISVGGESAHPDVIAGQDLASGFAKGGMRVSSITESLQRLKWQRQRAHGSKAAMRVHRVLQVRTIHIANLHTECI